MGTSAAQVAREQDRGMLAPVRVAWLLDGVGVLPTTVLLGAIVRAVVVADDAGDPLGAYSDNQIILGVLGAFLACLVWACAWHVGATFFRYLAARYEQAERHELERELRELADRVDA